MRAVASILSIIIFLAFATSGAQKLIFTTMASQSAEHLGFKKKPFQGVGLAEVVGAVGVLIGLAAKHGSFLAWLNAAAALGLLVMMLSATSLHLRGGDGFKGATPAMSLGAVCLLEVILRLV
jgi:uncharacterized membrane protein YphA (DoxX/SURF4 family)